MLEYERGKIRNPKIASQLVDFSGLRFERNITPTDHDGFLDFGGELFIWLEYKFEGTKMPFGQQLAYERECDACRKGGVKSLVIEAFHNTPESEQIDGAAAMVSRYYCFGQWRLPKTPITVRAAIDKFRAMTKVAE